jgi:pimeloyl-ACP methyl ester carboxylesterase
VRANGIRIEYDTFGDDSSPPLLLIMGFGGQMILWDREFCGQLAEAGFHVIRFDNRDVGLSSKLDRLGVPDLGEIFTAARRVDEVEVPYTLEDMGDDAIGLLDGLGLRRAHVCGASMGGMIAQIMAIRHPGRVSSLVSMASTTGDPEVASAMPDAIDAPAIPIVSVPRERESNIEYTVKGMRELAGTGGAFDEARARRVAAEVYDRCFCPEGAARQFLALLASGNRKPALARLTLPTLVIHGDRDPLVPAEHGKDTARAVPGADLLIIEGMGHNLPRETWPRIVAAIADHATKTRECGTMVGRS